MTPAKENYSTIEKGCLSVLHAVKHFRPFLYGQHFTLVSDHEPLRWINSVQQSGQRPIRWRLKLRHYDYSFRYERGKLNSNADDLSRNPVITYTNEFDKPENNNRNSLENVQVVEILQIQMRQNKITENPTSKTKPVIATSIPKGTTTKIKPAISTSIPEKSL